MHNLDEEELAHVGKILKKGYVRVEKPKKSVKDSLFCALYSLLALLFLALSVYFIYLAVNGSYFMVLGFIISGALFGISLAEVFLSYHQYPSLFGRMKYVKYPPKFITDPDTPVYSLSSQSSTPSPVNQSLHNFIPEETISVFKSPSDDEVVTCSTFEESVQFGKGPKMIRSVSQYEVENVPNQEQSTVKTVVQSSFSSSRKRFCHNIESEEDLMEMKTLPFVESSISAGYTEVDKGSEKGSSQSLPAIKFMSNSDA